MSTSLAIIAVTLALSVSCLHAYNVTAAEKWLATMGCNNASITNCPGNRLCTDTEYYARALAAGGVINLDPNDPQQQPYTNYEGFNLCLGQGFTNFLISAGFQQTTPMPNIPRGSIAFTQAWYPPGMPVFALGGGMCESHTPIINGGPHCDMECAYFVPKAVFLAPGA